MKLQQNNYLPFDGEVFLIKNLFSKLSLDDLVNSLEWRNDKIKMFGKEYSQARRVAWYGDEGVEYKYSNILMQAKPWTKELLEINKTLSQGFETDFNSVLINLYRNGHDYMSYHQDNEKELGDNPIIHSISLGESRDFHLKHIKSGEVVKILLEHGDLLIMQKETQTYWKHALPKRLKVKKPRLNLTFRKIYRL